MHRRIILLLCQRMVRPVMQMKHARQAALLRPWKSAGDTGDRLIFSFELIENAKTGEIDCLERIPDYKYWGQFMHELYDEQLVLIEGSHPWLYAPTVGGNCIAAAWFVVNILRNCATGDPNSYYTPIPVIQAVKGWRPRYRMEFHARRHQNRSVSVRKCR